MTTHVTILVQTHSIFRRPGYCHASRGIAAAAFQYEKVDHIFYAGVRDVHTAET